MGKRDPSFWKGALIPWFICMLAAVFYLYDFILRVTPSIIVHPLMKSYGIDAATVGFISAFYYYIYTPCQLPSGAVVDKYSPRWVLTVSVLFCAFGTLIFAYTHTLWIAYIARLMMGFGSAFAFVGALKLASLWLRRRYFALFTGMATALGTLGAVMTDTALSHLVHEFGWRQAVAITAYIGFGLAVLIILFVRDRPHWVPKPHAEHDSWVNIAKRLWQIMTIWRFWIIGIVGALLFLPVNMFASLWGIDFLESAYHLSAVHAASATSLIFWGITVAAPFVGWISDKIQSRRIPIFVGGFFTLVFTAILIYVTDMPAWLVYSLLFLIGVSVAPQILVFALTKEISPPNSTGVATAATNFAVTMSAAVFQPLTGWLLDVYWTGQKTALGTPFYHLQDYQKAFALLVGALLFSLIISYWLPLTKCQAIYPSQTLLGHKKGRQRLKQRKRRKHAS
jgi:MFS family permease